MFLVHSHSGLRYLALLAGLAVIAYAIYGATTRRPHDKNMRVLGSVFRWMMDIALFLGVAIIVTGYGFYPGLGVHIVLMTLATVVAHIVPAVMRRRPRSERTYAPYAVATAISLALVLVGTVALGRPVVG